MARLTIEQIKEDLLVHGFTLISKEYKNLDTELEIECEKGHRIFRTMKKFRQNQTCTVCMEEMSADYGVKGKVAKKVDGAFRTLALDQATTTSGFSVYDDAELIYFNKFTAKSKNAFERMAMVRNWLLIMLDDLEPDFVVLEDIQLEHGNVTTYKVLAQLQGTLAAALIERGIDFEFIPCATWRSYNKITGRSRNEKKKSAAYKVAKLFGVNPTIDEAEAILIGRYYVKKFKVENQIFTWV